MGLNIKNERVCALAKEAAALTGTTQTSAIEEALERLIAEQTEQTRAATRYDRLTQVLARIDATMTDRDRAAATAMVEAAMVVDGARDPARSREFDDLLRELDAEIVPFDAKQARIARDAFRDFGRGSGHPARLNFGDCLAYAAAKVTGEPLLFKGDDFTHTDIRPAI